MNYVAIYPWSRQTYILCISVYPKVKGLNYIMFHYGLHVIEYHCLSGLASYLESNVIA